MYEKISFVVSGRVQGVCFRAYAQEAARASDVTGWIRNRADARVEGEAYAERDDLERFISWLRQGSPHGHVDHVDLSRFEPVEERPPTFGIRY